MNKSSYVLAIVIIFSIHSAFGCINKEDSFSTPIFVIAFIFTLLFVSFLTLFVWTIKKVFFRNKIVFPTLIVLTSLISIVLGVVGSFVVPEFETIFLSFGEELPAQTRTILTTSHFLWIPFFLILFLWFFFKTAPLDLIIFLSHSFLK